MYKTIDVSLDSTKISTNDGFFVDNINYLYYTDVDNFYIDTSTVRTQEFAKISLSLSGNEVLVERSYNKIQDALANVEGTISILVFILAFLIIPYLEKRFFAKVILDSFDLRQYNIKEDLNQEVLSVANGNMTTPNIIGNQ